MFATMWVCAGRTEEIAVPGDFVLRDVAGESVIITRRKDGALAAHYNVCRHRGTRLCTDASGHFPDRIQCPYHGWTYDLDGRLLGAPHMDGASGFRRDENALTPVGVGEWDGHLFLTLGPSPPPLLEQLRGLPERFGAWQMGELRRAYRVTYEVKANWKLLMLNYSECLHCPLIHPALQRNADYLSGDNEPVTDNWFGGAMSLREGIFTMSRDGRQRRQPLPGLSDIQRRHGYYYAVLPNFLLSLHPDYVMTHTLWPMACDLHAHRLRVALPSLGTREPAVRSLLMSSTSGTKRTARTGTCRSCRRRGSPRAPTAPGCTRRGRVCCGNSIASCRGSSMSLERVIGQIEYREQGPHMALGPRDERIRPLCDMLHDLSQRYGRPMVIAETSGLGAGRPAWPKT